MATHAEKDSIPIYTEDKNRKIKIRRKQYPEDSGLPDKIVLEMEAFGVTP
jgi:hypothetical protein